MTIFCVLYDMGLHAPNIMILWIYNSFLCLHIMNFIEGNELLHLFCLYSIFKYIIYLILIDWALFIFCHTHHCYVISQKKYVFPDC